MFNWKTWSISLLQGAGVLAVVFGVLLLARNRGLAEGEVRALAFTTLVAGNLSLVLSNRSWTRGLWAILREPNPAMTAMFGLAAAVLALTLTVPFLAHLFRFEGLTGFDVAIAVAAAAVCLGWCELIKALRGKASLTCLP
jgi:Ca2+-transporting ATPase